jgi:hypothetical protein
VVARWCDRWREAMESQPLLDGGREFQENAWYALRESLRICGSVICSPAACCTPSWIRRGVTSLPLPGSRPPSDSVAQQ